MFVPSPPFAQFVTILRFTLVLSSSPFVSRTIERACLTNDDCDPGLVCNTSRNVCVCPNSFFWRDDTRACSDCFTGWMALKRSKCLLLPASHSLAITWNEAQRACRARIAQPVFISSTAEFDALARQIEYVSSRDDDHNGGGGGAAVDFHQGAWVEIDHEWTEAYVWCDKERKRGSAKCVRLWQDKNSRIACLQHVSCAERNHYICEALIRRRSRVDPFIDAVQSGSWKERNHGRRIRDSPENIRPSTLKAAVRTAAKTTIKITNKPVAVTTKKNSAAAINNGANVIINGINAAGQIGNAVTNVFGGGSGGNANQNALSQNNLINDPNNNNNLQAIASGNEKSDLSWKYILLVGGLVVGGIFVLLTVVFVVVFLLKTKKTTANNRKSVESAWSAWTSE